MKWILKIKIIISFQSSQGRLDSVVLHLTDSNNSRIDVSVMSVQYEGRIECWMPMGMTTLKGVGRGVTETQVCINFSVNVQMI